MAQGAPREAAIGWQPQPGPQLQALQCPAFEILYGGAAGGGKTDTLLAAALRNAQQAHYKGVIFRRTYPELEEVSERAKLLIPQIFPEAREATSRHEWKFPGGGKLLFRHLEDYGAALKHRSAEYTFVGFDELTTFEERQYLYLITRARNAHGLTPQLMSATNPGGPGHEWVFRRWGPWLDPKHPTRAQPGELRYFVSGPKGEDIWVPKGTPSALTRTFIPAKLSDNKVLTRADRAYELRLNSTDPLTRAQLKDGDWLAKPAPKTFFNRDWSPFVDAAPSRCRRARGWDRAATLPHPKNPDPDYTAGVKLAYDEAEDLWYVEHVERFRDHPGGVKQRLIETTETDGFGCEVALWRGPADAAKFEVEEYQKVLTAFVVSVWPESQNKIDKARPVSAVWAPRPGESYGRFRIVKGPWNEPFLSELEEMPDAVHDDQSDGLAVAFRAIASGGGVSDSSGVTKGDFRRFGGQRRDEDDPREETRRGGPRWGRGRT